MMSPQARFTALMRDHFADLPISIIEIGTASGLWTEHVLRNYPAVEKLYTIDPYYHFPGEKYEGGRPQEWHDYIKSVAIKRLNKFSNVEQILNTSEDALSLFNSETPFFLEFSDCIKVEVDVVYIDGNHNELNVRFDVENYYPLVREGGLFAGHDYNLPQIKWIVDEKFGNGLNVFEGERIWWTVKTDTLSW